MKDAAYWVNKLGLQPHPEGGFYLESYRSIDPVNAKGIALHEEGTRSLLTAIYYLLDGSGFSAFHRIKSDELWFHQYGGEIEVHVIHPDGRYELIRLGANIESNACMQAFVPAGAWFGSRLKKGDSFALAACVVSPGFDFADFEMAKRENLLREFPAHEPIIRELTHP